MPVHRPARPHQPNATTQARNPGRDPTAPTASATRSGHSTAAVTSTRRNETLRRWIQAQFSWGKKTPSAQSASACREEARVPEGEPCPYCAHLAPNPEELRLHLLHLHPEVEPEPDWWDRDAVPPPPLLL
jgi:hypothetical protein